MAIGVRTPNAPDFDTKDLVPTVAAAQVTGDMMILIAGGKPYNLAWSVATTGWTALSRGESGTTAAGVVTFRVSGGTVGATSSVTVQITMASGRKQSRTTKFNVLQR